jgi:hypothetical protein
VRRRKNPMVTKEDAREKETMERLFPFDGTDVTENNIESVALKVRELRLKSKPQRRWGASQPEVEPDEIKPA